MERVCSSGENSKRLSTIGNMLVPVQRQNIYVRYSKAEMGEDFGKYVPHNYLKSTSYSIILYMDM